MNQEINGRALGKSLIFSFVFLALWFTEVGIEGFWDAIFYLALIIWFGILFVDAMGDLFKK